MGGKHDTGGELQGVPRHWDVWIQVPKLYGGGGGEFQGCDGFSEQEVLVLCDSVQWKEGIGALEHGRGNDTALKEVVE